jgi:hypothetical protein
MMPMTHPTRKLPSGGFWAASWCWNALVVAIVLLQTVRLLASTPQHFSTSQGASVLLHPSGATLQLPIDWGASLTTKELQGVKQGKGEWYTEYAEVINAALPFSACSLEAGRFLWRQGAFRTVQMRAYVLHSTLSNIEARIATKGLTAAKALPYPTARNAFVNKEETPQWHKISIGYDLNYVDYGGKANIEFYVTTHENWTVVLVFMHSGTTEPDEVRQIINSFSWQ